MNFLKLLKERKENNTRFNSTSNTALRFLEQSCVDIDKILKNIHALEDNSLIIEDKKVNEHLYSQRLLNNLSDFECDFSRFNEEVKDLKSLVSTFKLSRKQNKIYVMLTEATEAQQFSFLETYSRFLVKCQIHHTRKTQIKEKYIQVIKNLEIPLHTESAEHTVIDN